MVLKYKGYTIKLQDGKPFTLNESGYSIIIEKKEMVEQITNSRNITIKKGQTKEELLTSIKNMIDRIEEEIVIPDEPVQNVSIETMLNSLNS